MDENQLFENALQIAENELLLPYFYTNPENIYALVKYGNNPLFTPRINSFIEKSFDTLRKVAKERQIAEAEKWNYEASVIINHVAVGAIARATAILGAKELAPLLYKELLDINAPEQGTICIALSILEYEGDIKEIKDKLDDAVSNKYYILEREETLEMFYAFCILKKDKIRAIDYLSNYQRTKNLSLVAAALADLDVKEGLPILKERLLHVNSPFTKEAFLEAIHRLEMQKTPPLPMNRMIWMFGQRSSTELALGHESDNEFVLRAIKKNGGKEFEDYHESFY